jgi:hypothetical protein
MDTFDTTVKVVARRAPLGEWWCWHYFRFAVDRECRVTHRAGDQGQGPQAHTGNMTKYRNYWIFSIACFVVWGVILAVIAAQGKSDKTHAILLVFGGWVIAWVSGTIARFVYPPPSRWLPSGAPASGE